MSSPNQVYKSGATNFGERKGSGAMFSGIEHYKRKDGSAAQARRESLQDMQPKSGFVASLWNRYDDPFSFISQLWRGDLY